MAAILSKTVTAQLAGAVYRMIQEVIAAGGASRAYTSMMVLQQTWNANKTALKDAGVAWFKLTEDGKYGPNTATALKILTGVATPAKTAGLLAWYSNNHDVIDAFANVASAAPIITPASPVTAQPIPWGPSNADLDDVDRMHGAVYLMVTEIAAAGGQSRAYDSVRLFQQTWNDSRTTVNHFYDAGLLTKAWFNLTEDGKYGSNTGKALSAATSVKTPSRTYDLVAWYATNRNLVAGYTSAAEKLSGGHAETAISNAKAEPSPAEVIAAASAVGQNAGSGSLAREQVPNQPAYNTDQGTLVDTSGSGTKASDAWNADVGSTVIGSSVAARGTLLNNTTTTPPQAIDSKIAVANEIAKIAPSVTAVDFSEESVFAQKPRTNLKVFAIGAGLLAALGVFGYMASKKTRRRYA